MLARTPVSLARVRLQPPPVRKLRRSRRIAIREMLAGIMRSIEPTAFAAEGPCRAGIRSRLCEDGWPWGQADAEAELLVLSALQVVGVRRPSWRMGQPEHTQDGYTPRERERCARCAKPLTESRWRYCSDVCKRAAKVDRNSKRSREDLRIAEIAAELAWQSRQPPRSCPTCKRDFTPKRRRQTFCSRACSSDAMRAAARRRLPMVCTPV
jgi:hypothetical protein